MENKNSGIEINVVVENYYARMGIVTLRTEENDACFKVGVDLFKI